MHYCTYQWAVARIFTSCLQNEVQTLNAPSSRHEIFPRILKFGVSKKQLTKWFVFFFGENAFCCFSLFINSTLFSITRMVEFWLCNALKWLFFFYSKCEKVPADGGGQPPPTPTLSHNHPPLGRFTPSQAMFLFFQICYCLMPYHHKHFTLDDAPSSWRWKMFKYIVSYAQQWYII